MKPQVHIENGIGRNRIEDNKWELFADPEQSPELFDHSHGEYVQFLGESWETGPWIVPNRFGPGVKSDRHSHNYDTIYYVLPVDDVQRLQRLVQGGGPVLGTGGRQIRTGGGGPRGL